MTQKSKILYIEDNPDSTILVKKALEAKGFEFLHAQNGLQGVEIAQTQSPDLILLSINLPDMDGCEVARRLRKTQSGAPSYTPLIAVTINALRGDAEKALAAGCDVYITKPINIRELWARVEAFLINQD